MKVELKPYIAKIAKDGTKTEFDQWYLLVDGVQWGIVPKQDGGHIFFIVRDKTDEEKAEVKRLVEEQIGERSKVVAPPEELEEDTELEEDEDEDESA